MKTLIPLSVILVLFATACETPRLSAKTTITPDGAVTQDYTESGMQLYLGNRMQTITPQGLDQGITRGEVQSAGPGGATASKAGDVVAGASLGWGIGSMLSSVLTTVKPIPAAAIGAALGWLAPSSTPEAVETPLPPPPSLPAETEPKL